MGSFAGHVDEATLFLAVALWWMYNAFPAYLRAVWHGEDFKCQLSYGIHCKRKIPIEPILKMAFTMAGFIAELTDMHPHFIDEDNHFTNLNKLQHMSIYGLFFLHSTIDLLTHLGAPIPRGFDMLSGALCMVWYGISFSFHANMHGKDGVERMIHLLPINVMFLAALCLVIETIRPSWFLAHVTRIFSLLVLGTWFIHTSFILYLPTPFPGSHPNPAWDRTDMRNEQFLVAAFGYHLCLNLVVVTIFYLLTVFILKARGAHKPQFRQMAPLTNGSRMFL